MRRLCVALFVAFALNAALFMVWTAYYSQARLELQSFNFTSEFAKAKNRVTGRRSSRNPRWRQGHTTTADLIGKNVSNASKALTTLSSANNKLLPDSSNSSMNASRTLASANNKLMRNSSLKASPTRSSANNKLLPDPSNSSVNATPMLSSGNIKLLRNSSLNASPTLSPANIKLLPNPSNSSVILSRTPKRCVEGVDQLDRSVQFWKYNDEVIPGLNDAFAKDNRVYFVFLVRDSRHRLQFTADNTDWTCIFNDCEPSKSDYVIDGSKYERETQIVSCRIPQPCLARWRALDPHYVLAQNVSLTARSATDVPFRYDQIQFCRYPSPDEWAPAIRARKLGTGGQRGPPLFLAACCFFIVHSARNREMIVEWIAYHTLQGLQHLYVYANEESRDIRTLLRPHIASGLVSVIEWRWPSRGQLRLRSNVSKWTHQLSQLNSCVHRYRGLARWVGQHAQSLACGANELQLRCSSAGQSSRQTTEGKLISVILIF